MKDILHSVILLVISFAPLISWGQQNWAQPGAVWFYGYGDGTSIGSTGYVEIRKVGDTLFNGIQCDILTFHFDYIQNWPGGTHQNYYGQNRYTYISNDTVYINYGLSFETLFLTNSPPGSFWITGPDESGNCPGDTIVVDSLLSVNLNGFILNRIVPVPADLWPQFPQLPPTVTFNDPLYNRFGSIGYFFPLAYCITDGMAGPLCYYSDSGGFVYSNFVSPYCDNVPTGLGYNSLVQTPILSPNISSGDVKLNVHKLDVNLNLYIHIIDLNGKYVDKIQVNEPNTVFNISHLENGIYVCRIIIGNKEYNNKLVKY